MTEAEALSTIKTLFADQLAIMKNDKANDESEKNSILQEIGKEKYTLQRSKGLGENEADMMWMTTMNPATRRLIKVTPSDVEETVRVFYLLLGDDLQGRKDYISMHGSEYIDELDVS